MEVIKEKQTLKNALQEWQCFCQSCSTLRAIWICMELLQGYGLSNNLMSSACKLSFFGKPPKLKKVSTSFFWKSVFTQTEQPRIKKDRLQKKCAYVFMGILVNSTDRNLFASHQSFQSNLSAQLTKLKTSLNEQHLFYQLFFFFSFFFSFSLVVMILLLLLQASFYFLICSA